MGEYAFPRGWFAVAQGTEIGRSPFSVHYFEYDLVLYRASSGRVVILDAYCPHMGTRLGSGPNSASATSESFMEAEFYNPRAKAAEIVARVASRHFAKGMPAFTLEAAE